MPLYLHSIYIMPFKDIETAKACAMRSVEVRKLNAAARVLNGGKPLEDVKPSLEAYQLRQLVRVRDKLDKLDRILDSLLDAEEIDSNAIEKTTRALSNLSELERQLVGRPLPGTAKPGTGKAVRQVENVVPTLGVAPIQPAPAPESPAVIDSSSPAIDPEI